jgi:hypothetical protein
LAVAPCAVRAGLSAAADALTPACRRIPRADLLHTLSATALGPAGRNVMLQPHKVRARAAARVSCTDSGWDVCPALPDISF